MVPLDILERRPFRRLSKRFERWMEWWYVLVNVSKKANDPDGYLAIGGDPVEAEDLADIHYTGTAEEWGQFLAACVEEGLLTHDPAFGYALVNRREWWRFRSEEPEAVAERKRRHRANKEQVTNTERPVTNKNESERTKNAKNDEDKISQGKISQDKPSQGKGSGEGGEGDTPSDPRGGGRLGFGGDAGGGGPSVPPPMSVDEALEASWPAVDLVHRTFHEAAPPKGARGRLRTWLADHTGKPIPWQGPEPLKPRPDDLGLAVLAACEELEWQRKQGLPGAQGVNSAASVVLTRAEPHIRPAIQQRLSAEVMPGRDPRYRFRPPRASPSPASQTDGGDVS